MGLLSASSTSFSRAEEKDDRVEGPGGKSRLGATTALTGESDLRTSRCGEESPSSLATMRLGYAATTS